MNACCVLLGGIGCVAHDADHSARCAGHNGRKGEDRGRCDRPSAEHGDRGRGSDSGERDQRDGRGDQMAHQQLAAFDRQAVGAVGLVDFLRQRLHRLETEQEQHQRGADHRRRRAAHDHRLEHAGHRREGGHPHQPRRREAGHAGDAAAGDRVA